MTVEPSRPPVRCSAGFGYLVFLSLPRQPLVQRLLARALALGRPEQMLNDDEGRDVVIGPSEQPDPPLRSCVLLADLEYGTGRDLCKRIAPTPQATIDQSLDDRSGLLFCDHVDLDVPVTLFKPLVRGEDEIIGVRRPHEGQKELI